MSTFTWLDYSEQDRRQMLDVIQLFREPGTLDELGIGTVRDAFADLLFPGTSTIQTRARYFLFIPWIYRDLERRQVPSVKVEQRARYEEGRLMAALAKNDPNEIGIIGRDAGRSLKRLPSTVYWRGLYVWGIRRFPGSQAQYHQTLDAFYAANRRIQLENQANDVHEPLRHNWHPTLPDPSSRFPDDATLALRDVEAHYLRERMFHSVPDTLLAFLVEYGRLTPFTRFPWQHPQCSELPAVRQEELVHARNFSETIRGAFLLYNYMLAEKTAATGGNVALMERYAMALEEWAEMLAQRAYQLAQWDWQQRFWQFVTITNANIPYRTRQFVETWLALVLAPGTVRNIASNVHARDLIAHRERQLKRHLARLHNPRALELWSGASGTSQLDYRWGVVQTLLNDIWRGYAENQPRAEVFHA